MLDAALDLFYALGQTFFQAAREKRREWEDDGRRRRRKYILKRATLYVVSFPSLSLSLSVYTTTVDYSARATCALGRKCQPSRRNQGNTRLRERKRETGRAVIKMNVTRTSLFNLNASAQFYEATRYSRGDLNRIGFIVSWTETVGISSGSHLYFIQYFYKKRISCIYCHFSERKAHYFSSSLSPTKEKERERGLNIPLNRV